MSVSCKHGNKDFDRDRKLIGLQSDYQFNTNDYSVYS
jgi:hypothetical protein